MSAGVYTVNVKTARLAISTLTISRRSQKSMLLKQQYACLTALSTFVLKHKIEAVAKYPKRHSFAIASRIVFRAA